MPPPCPSPIWSYIPLHCLQQEYKKETRYVHPMFSSLCALNDCNLLERKLKKKTCREERKGFHNRLAFKRSQEGVESSLCSSLVCIIANGLSLSHSIQVLRFAVTGSLIKVIKSSLRDEADISIRLCFYSKLQILLCGFSSLDSSVN